MRKAKLDEESRQAVEEVMDWVNVRQFHRKWKDWIQNVRVVFRAFWGRFSFCELFDLKHNSRGRWLRGWEWGQEHKKWDQGRVRPSGWDPVQDALSLGYWGITNSDKSRSCGKTQWAKDWQFYWKRRRHLELRRYVGDMCRTWCLQRIL